MVKVSVIIPIYNSEKYLERCLESVAGQTLEDIEIFCVDDGSTDKSWEMIQRFAKRDKRIIALQQENAGAAVARNKGLELAKGEYIGFVDSDDYVDKTYFEHLYETAKRHKADVARAYIKAGVANDGEERHKLGREDVDYESYHFNEELKDLILKNKLNQRSVIWLAIYKRQMLDRNKVRFSPEIRTGQDALFSIKTGYFANKIVYVDKPTYYHRVVRGGSLMTQYVYSDSGLLSRSYVFRELVDFLNSRWNYDRDVYGSHVFIAVGFVLDRISYIQDKEMARKIAKILADTWKKTKYKDDIRYGLWDIDERFTAALEDEAKLFEFMSDISCLDGLGVRVSVILPVYNQEKYLEQCLRSIQHQTLKGIEIICVNDGSTDSSSKIIHRFARKDRRIKIIDKENGGVSTARNAGFDMATGKYTIFLDSDDFFEPKLLERLYSRMEQTRADIAVCNFKTYFDSMQKFSEPRLDFKVFRSKKLVSYETNPDDIFNGLTLMFWNKMFRTEFLRKSGIRNDESLHRAQDVDFVGRAVVSTKKIAVVDESLVCYRTDVGESNVRRIYKYPYDVLTAFAQFKTFLEGKSLYKKVRKSYLKIAADHILAALYFAEIYPVHRQIHARSKKFLQELGVQDAADDCFSDEKSRSEARMLVNTSYIGWLQYRVRDLRDDREAKYISYLLGEFQRRHGEEVAIREDMERSISWKVTRPLRIAGKILRRR